MGDVVPIRVRPSFTLTLDEARELQDLMCGARMLAAREERREEAAREGDGGAWYVIVTVCSPGPPELYIVK